MSPRETPPSSPEQRPSAPSPSSERIRTPEPRKSTAIITEEVREIGYQMEQALLALRNPTQTAPEEALKGQLRKLEEQRLSLLKEKSLHPRDRDRLVWLGAEHRKWSKETSTPAMPNDRSTEERQREESRRRPAEEIRNYNRPKESADFKLSNTEKQIFAEREARLNPPSKPPGLLEKARTAWKNWSWRKKN